MRYNILCSPKKISHLSKIAGIDKEDEKESKIHSEVERKRKEKQGDSNGTENKQKKKYKLGARRLEPIFLCFPFLERKGVKKNTGFIYHTTGYTGYSLKRDWRKRIQRKRREENG